MNIAACAAANASLDLFAREPRLRQVVEISARLQDGLAPCRDLPGVKDVRVKGAIGVVELDRIGDLDCHAMQIPDAIPAARHATDDPDGLMHVLPAPLVTAYMRERHPNRPPSAGKRADARQPYGSTRYPTP